MDLLEHSTYRSVLRSWLGEHPNRSQTFLARRVGVSRSLVAMVLHGERDLNLSQAKAWGRALSLNGDDLDYWETLVRCEHGETLALRRAARQQASALADFLKARRPQKSEAPLLARWYVPVILELRRCEDFQPTTDWLSTRLWPQPDPVELEEALAQLSKLGILDGTQSVATERELDDDELTAMARTYHRQQLAHASEALDAFSQEQRYLGSLSVAIRHDQLPQLVEALHQFQLQVIEPHRSDDPDMVVQVNVQLFPRTSE